MVETELSGTRVLCSWSGGKDSALALHGAVAAGAMPRLLVSMLTEGGERSRSHGLAKDLLRAQAEALGLPIRFGAATWDGYRDEFLRLLREGVAEHDARVGVFGDIDMDDHRRWEEGVCAEVGAEACLPLWQRERPAVIEELFAAGFEAVIVAVRDGVLPPAMLGRTLDPELIVEIEAAGADVCGEHGEYHSVVVDGPLFQRALRVEPGERSLRDGVWFLDLTVADPAPL